MNEPGNEETIERIAALLDSDQELRAVVDTGGSTDYAHIYLTAFSGTHNGNEMLWLKYVWLSRENAAYQNDMIGDNGMSIRLSDGMTDALRKLMVYTLSRETETGEPIVFEA